VEVIKAIHQMTNKSFTLVHERFRVHQKGYLRSHRVIANPIDIDAVLGSITAGIVVQLDSPLKDRLRQHLLSAVRQTHLPLLQYKEKLSTLAIYKELVPGGENDQEPFKSVYASLPASHVYPISEARAIPMLANVHFFDASEDNDESLFKSLGFPMLSTQNLLNKFVIPFFQQQPAFLLDRLAEFIFSEASLREWVSSLSTVPFIKLQSRNGNAAAKRQKPTAVISAMSEIAQLYFDDETVFGSGIYSEAGQYKMQMELLGMKRELRTDIVEERITSYSNRSLTDDALFDKCKLLLVMLNSHHTNIELKKDWLPLIKLPAFKDGNSVLDLFQCRSDSFRPFVKGVLGLVPIHVDPALEEFFGWNRPLDPELIGARIDVIVASNSSSTVQNELYDVLQYISDLETERKVPIVPYIAKVKANISAEAWLPGQINGLWKPERIFFKAARDFQPYMSELPISYYQSFGNILKYFGVVPQPRPDQIVEFIAMLQNEDALSPRDFEAVIYALECLQSEHDDFFSKELMIPDVDMKLIRIDGFTPVDDNNGQNVRYAHRRVPRSLVQQLGIPQLANDLGIFQYLNGSNLFDYFQEENFVDRISKAIKEVSLWSAFNEFVANAEDCGSATRVHWILDRENVRFPVQHLLCEALQSWQTPALYVYNDGVFSEDDFDALIGVGMGSKAADTAKIGNYGLGSLTMYLFTDVPSIISGEYFVLFDPSRTYLPYIDLHRGRRRAGLKISLAQMTSHFKDHLRPFVGIGGYTLGF
jgi:sacsin